VLEGSVAASNQSPSSGDCEVVAEPGFGQPGREFDAEMAAPAMRRTPTGTGAKGSTRVRMEAWRIGDGEFLGGRKLHLPLGGGRQWTGMGCEFRRPRAQGARKVLGALPHKRLLKKELVPFSLRFRELFSDVWPIRESLCEAICG